MPRKRPSAYHGVLLLHKPQGVSSAFFSRKIGHCLGTTQIGHTGTLDPFAEGLLPLCIGRATKISPYITEGDKEYSATIRLGIETDTYDLEGEAISEKSLPETLNAKTLEQVLNRFRGQIEQMPPAFSAKKVSGVPSYHLARKGKAVALQPKRVTLNEIELLSFETPLLKLRIKCSKGTYIRSLAHDIGNILGCGAHLMGLIRTQHGNFHLRNAVRIEQIQQSLEANRLDAFLTAHLLTSDNALGQFPSVRVPKSHLAYIHQGRSPNAGWLRGCLGQVESKEAIIKLVDNDDHLIALIEKNVERDNVQSQAEYRYLRVFPPIK